MAVGGCDEASGYDCAICVIDWDFVLTGSGTWTIVSPATVNSLTNVVVSPNWYNSTLTTMTCKAGGIIYIKLATTCTTGNNYAATVFLSDGNKITYTAPAP